MACNCEGKVINIGMGCCVPVVANANHYYTKSEVDEKLDDIVASGCCITPEEVDDKISAATSGFATEQWVTEQGYLTEHQSLSAYSTTQEVTNMINQSVSGKQDTLIAGDNITISGNVISSVGSGSTDLSNYYNKEEIDAMLDDKATKTWVLNQHFVTNSELIQYINNLQIQINSLQESISGCCGGGGTAETIYRWITMTGENDYECSGTTKYTKEKKQQSTDNGVTWEDVTPAETRRGNTVLEENSVDCGYVAPSKISGTLRSGSTYKVDCNGNSILSLDDTKQYITGNGASVSAKMETAVVGNCVTEIKQAFDRASYLTAVTIPNSVSAITYMAFYECRSLASINIPDSVKMIGGASCFASCFALTAATIGNGIESIGEYAFYDCTHLTKVTINATTPPELGRGAFSGIDGNGTALSYPIYVPAASVNAYKSAWTSYASRIQPIQ